MLCVPVRRNGVTNVLVFQDLEVSHVCVLYFFELISLETLMALPTQAMAKVASNALRARSK